jgi:hypothetical protein
MTTRKYQVPIALGILQLKYERWLSRKAVAHVRRDKRRGNVSAVTEAYKIAIHKAVLASNGEDFYTGECLDWTLISKYDNASSMAGRRKYKSSFALLPTVDHLGDGTGSPEFVICGWRTNDAKNDLNYEQFLELCDKVVAASKKRARSAAAGADSTL